MPAGAPGEGGAVQVTKGGGDEAFESPDGKLYYTKSWASRGLWSVPVGGGEEMPVLEPVWSSYWAVAEKGIYFLDLDAGPSPNSPKLLRF